MSALRVFALVVLEMQQFLHNQLGITARLKATRTGGGERRKGTYYPFVLQLATPSYVGWLEVDGHVGWHAYCRAMAMEVPCRSSRWISTEWPGHWHWRTSWLCGWAAWTGSWAQWKSSHAPPCHCDSRPDGATAWGFVGRGCQSPRLRPPVDLPGNMRPPRRPATRQGSVTVPAVSPVLRAAQLE